MSTLSKLFNIEYDKRYSTVLVVKTETGAEAIIPAGAVSWQRAENSADTSNMDHRTIFYDDLNRKHIVWTLPKPRV